MSQEPSMEDILSSIKRIIAEDGDAISAGRRARRGVRQGGDDARPGRAELRPDDALLSSGDAPRAFSPLLDTEGAGSDGADDDQEAPLSTLGDAFAAPEGARAPGGGVLELTQALDHSRTRDALNDPEDAGDHGYASEPLAEDVQSGFGDALPHAAHDHAVNPWASDPAVGTRTSAAKASILSEASARASRDSLAMLSSMVVRGEEGDPLTLEALVRDMLRPMLGEWLDANLPALVENLVAREIARIAARNA